MKKTGKRLAAMILVSALAAALAGCGGKSSGEGSGTEKAEANKDGVHFLLHLMWKIRRRNTEWK